MNAPTDVGGYLVSGRSAPTPACTPNSSRLWTWKTTRNWPASAH